MVCRRDANKRDSFPGRLRCTWGWAVVLQSIAAYYFYRYMDELRISKGIARWTANFTPPTKAYAPDPLTTRFSVSAPASATATTPFNVTVTALTAAGFLNTGYTGTVHFTSTNGNAVLPANSALVNGVGMFAVTLNAVGSFTVTATDGSITGVSAAISAAAPTPQTLAFGGTQSWTVPGNWNNSNNSIEVMGGGGNGGTNPGNYGAGGGGGGYAKKSNAVLTPGTNCTINVGGPAAASSFVNNVGTTICGATGGGNGWLLSFTWRRRRRLCR